MLNYSVSRIVKKTPLKEYGKGKNSAITSRKHFLVTAYSVDSEKIKFIWGHMPFLFLLLHKLKKLKALILELCSIKHCFEGSTDECQEVIPQWK